METLGTFGHMGAMHGIAMACVSAPCFSCYQYGNSRPVFCHAQPPCFKLGSQILALGLHVCFQFSAVVSTLFCVKAIRRSRIIPKTLALSVVTQCRWVDSPTRRLLPEELSPTASLLLCRKKEKIMFEFLPTARCKKSKATGKHWTYLLFLPWHLLQTWIWSI